MPVPYTFANATGNIPLNQLDANFANVSQFSETAGTVTANAQPNIRSLGTLFDLTVSGNVVAARFAGDGSQLTGIIAEATTIAAANVTGLASVATTGNYDSLINRPTIPTATNQLVNNSGFITIASVPTATSQLINNSGFITQAAVPTQTSQLINNSGFITAAAIPTNVSAFTNDAGYITIASVPTQTSQLTNNSGFITAATANVISVNGQTGAVTLSIPPVYNDSNVAAYLPNYTGDLAGSSLDITSPGGNTWSIIDRTLTTPNGGTWYSNPDGIDSFITSPANGYLTLQSLFAGPAFDVASDIKLEHTFIRIGVYDGTNFEWTFDESGNLTAPGNINAVGNITADYFIGDGSQLTGLPASYGNADVAAYLPVYNGNLLANEINASNVTSPTINSTGTIQANVINSTGNISGANAFFPGNVDAGFFIGDGSQLTNTYGNSNVGSYLTVYSGNLGNTFQVSDIRVNVTSVPFRLPTLTDAQIANLSPLNGDMVYNTTIGKIQGYESGAWGNLIGF